MCSDLHIICSRTDEETSVCVCVCVCVCALGSEAGSRRYLMSGDNLTLLYKREKRTEESALTIKRWRCRDIWMFCIVELTKNTFHKSDKSGSSGKHNANTPGDVKKAALDCANPPCWEKEHSSRNHNTYIRTYVRTHTHTWTRSEGRCLSWKCMHTFARDKAWKGTSLAQSYPLLRKNIRWLRFPDCYLLFFFATGGVLFLFYFYF